MRRRFDIRRIPLTLLFVGTAGIIFGYLAPDYVWLYHYNFGDFILRLLLLIPVAAFFASLATLILWYLFRITLPGLLRYRRLRMIRYQRSLRPRREELSIEEARLEELLDEPLSDDFHHDEEDSPQTH